MMRYYIDGNGNFLGGWEIDPPNGSIEVDYPPEWYDQVWLFPLWSPSPAKAAAGEVAWREEQMARIANQLLMIEDEDPDAEPGTKRQWMDYRIALRKWVTDGNPDFPDQEKRPVAPT